MQSMSIDSTFAHIGDNSKSNQSVNHILTPASSTDALMGDNTSQSGDNMRSQLPIRGHLGNVDPVEEIERPRTFRERLAPERNAAPS